MSGTVDKRIVQMSFENEEFERGVSKTLGSVDRLKKSLVFDEAGKNFDSITKAANAVNLGSIADGVNSISNKFSALGIIGITTLMNLANTAVEAGKRMVMALTIDPIKTGMNEYETKLNAIQTILANTQKEGTDLGRVTKALDDLNEYSDKTIYNFQEMTRNVGTFTAAGVKLDESVAAIKGIANLAAVSGSNSQQASTAMYQLSQALATGTVRLMDWNSVVNAGMGGAVFQDAIKETARVHGVAVDDIIKREGSFRDSLQKGWLTSEILTETLQKFTGDLNEDQLRSMGYSEDQIKSIIKLGQTANDAATKVKTFSQLFSTLKEAAQSGWAKTWELIIGDFNEAKSFLTDLNNWFGGILNASADARNNLITGWRDLGGRTAMLESFSNILNAILSVLEPIRTAFRMIFPPTTAQQLMAITTAILNFTKRLKLSEPTALKVGRIFRGLFAILDIGRMFFVELAKGVGTLLGSLAPASGGILDMLAHLGDLATMLRDNIKNSQIFKTWIDGIVSVLKIAASAIGGFVLSLREAFNAFRQTAAAEGFLAGVIAAVKKFIGFFENLKIAGVSEFVENFKARFAPLGKIGDFLVSLFKSVRKALEPVLTVLGKIRDAVRKALGTILQNVIDGISNIDLSKINFDKTFDTINTGLLGVLMLAITGFVRKGTGLFSGIVDVFKGVTGAIGGVGGILTSISGILDGVKGVLVSWQQDIKAGILMKIASAVGILAVSLIALSMIDSKKLTVALGAITALFGDLMGSLAIYEKISGGGTLGGIKAMSKGVIGMIGAATAILVLTGALVVLSNVDTEGITRGLVALGIMMTELAVFMRVTDMSGLGVLKSVGLLVLAAAIGVIGIAVAKIAEIDTGKMTKGLLAIGLIFGAIAAFSAISGGGATILALSVGVGILSISLLGMANVLEKIGKLSWEEIAKGLVALAGALTLIGAAGYLIPPTLIIQAAGLIVMAEALIILNKALTPMSEMTWEEIGRGLVALGGSLLVLAIGMNAMSGGLLGAAAIMVASVALLALAPALKILGEMSWKGVGVALTAIAGFFTVLGVAALIMVPVVPILLALSVAIAILGVAMLAAGSGMLAFSSGLAMLATVGAAGMAAFGGAIAVLASLLPVIGQGIAKAIVSFAKTLKDGIPALMDAGSALILGFLKSLTTNIPAIVEMLLTFIDTFLKTVSEQIPSIVESGFKLLIGFLDGMRQNIGQVTQISIDIVNEYINAVAEKIPEIVDSGWNLIISWIDGMTQGVQEHLPELIESVRKLGIAIVLGVAQGISEGAPDGADAIIDLANIIINTFKEKLGIHSPSDVFITLMKSVIDGIVLGIQNGIGSVKAKMMELVASMTTTLTNKYADMWNAGKALVDGFAKGIEAYVFNAVEKAKNLATSVVTAVKNILGIKSPSKVMEELGKFIDLGLGGGITKFTGYVVESAKGLGETTVSTFSGVLSKVSDTLDANADFNPTITPVVDLSNVLSSSDQINSMFGKKTLSLSAATVQSTNAARNVQTPESTGKNIAGQNAQISFVQNNYSPKELARVDIYRQTKTQLMHAKGILGA